MNQNIKKFLQKLKDYIRKILFNFNRKKIFSYFTKILFSPIFVSDEFSPLAFEAKQKRFQHNVTKRSFKNRNKSQFHFLNIYFIL